MIDIFHNLKLLSSDLRICTCFISSYLTLWLFIVVFLFGYFFFKICWRSLGI